jgi:hypothetical protein
MIARKSIEDLLQSRLRDAVPPQQLESLLADLRGLDAEWEEVPVTHREMGYSMSVQCPDICWLADQIYQGAQFKFYRKKT